MTRRAPLQIKMFARAVIAYQRTFEQRGEVFHDAGVARDEVSTLRPTSEPLVLRVEVRGGAAKDRRKLAGDWLCESDGSAPRILPAPPWSPRNPSGAWLYSNQSEAWAKRRPLLDAWEWCADPRWLLHAAGMVGVDLRLVALAACACARTALRVVPSAVTTPRRAIEVTEAWARGGASTAELREMSQAVRATAYSPLAANDDSFAHAADAAYAATRMAIDAHAHHVAGHPYANGPSYGAGEVADAAANALAPTSGGRQRVLEELAILVRQHIPTLAMLRASIV